MANDYFDQFQFADDNDYFSQFESEPSTFLNRQDRQGAPGVAQDVGEGLKDFYSNLIPGAINYAEGIGSAGIQGITDPARFAQNLGAGVTKFGQNIGNLPGAANQYIESRFGEENKVPLFDMMAFRDKPEPRTPDEGTWERISRSIHLPKPGEFDYAEALGLSAPKSEHEDETDKFLQQLVSQAFSAAGGGAAGLAANELAEGKNPFTMLGIPATKTIAKNTPKIAKESIKTVKKGANAIVKKIDEIAPEKYSQAKTVKKANKIVSDLENYYDRNYNKVTNDPRLPGIEWDVPDQVFKAFNEVNSKDSVIIDKALTSKHPTDVHHAASKVGKYIYNQEKSLAPNHTGLSYAYKIKEAMEMGLDNSLRTVPELEFSYRNLDKQFAGDLGRVGHKVRSKLKRYRENKVGTENVMRTFRLPEGAEEFRHRFGEELPGIDTAKHPDAWQNLPITNLGVSLFKKHFGKK